MAVIEAIATTYLEAQASTVVFDSLGSYEHLQLRMSLRTVATGTYGLGEMRFGSGGAVAYDSGANYSHHFMSGTGTTEAAAAATGADAARFYTYATSDMDSADFGTVIIDILDYQNTAKNVTYSYLGSAPNTAGGMYLVVGSGLWNKTGDHVGEALTKFYVQSPSYVARGSEISLYGLNSS